MAAPTRCPTTSTSSVPDDVEKHAQSSFATVVTPPPLCALQTHAFANPSPLGLVSFASSTLLISLINAQTRGVTTPSIITGMAFFVGGLAQFVAGVCEFAVGNTFGMTVSCSYGGYWMTIGLLFWPSSGMMAAYATQDELNNAQGLFMMVWFVFTVIMTLGAIHCSVGLFLVFFGLALIYLLLGIGYLLDQVAVIKASGYVGIFTAFIAYFTVAETLYKANGLPITLCNPTLCKKRE